MSAEIAELSFARWAFFEKMQPVESARVTTLIESKRALGMLKRGLIVAIGAGDSEGKFLVSRLMPKFSSWTS